MRALLVSAFVITYNDFSEQEEYKAMLLGCKNARGLVILLAVEIRKHWDVVHTKVTQLESWWPTIT